MAANLPLSPSGPARAGAPPEAASPPPARRAFTLVELLVAIGIIALLVAILLPVINKARASANRTKCAAHMGDVGKLFQMYLNDSRNKLPWVNLMPSVQPPLNKAPSIVQVLEPYHGGATGVFECPADRITEPATGAPPDFERYFDREQTSFMYSTRLAVDYAGKQLPEAFRDMEQRNLPKELLHVMREYEPYHGKAGQKGSMNYLFPDMHVADLID